MTPIVMLWWICWGLLAVPVLVLAGQVIAASLAKRAELTPVAAQRHGRVVVLVPAHNEQSVIVHTLQSLQTQLQARDRLLVVADNCDDDTAALARSVGAEVVERRDGERRGKGYALDFGVRHLAGDSADALLIVDADCRLAPGVVDRLAEHAVRLQRPVQARYVMVAGPAVGVGLRMAEWAWRIKNVVRPMGASCWGGACQLMGTGMAFPWRLVSCMPLATDHLVEDMKLGLDLALQGYAPVFCPEALVTSEFPQTDQAIRSQRKRWEHGHLGLLLQQGPRMLLHALRRRDLGLLSMALDLSVPPLALLSLTQAGLVVVALVLHGYVGAIGPVVAGACAFGLLGATVLLAWAGWGRDIVSGRELLRVPFYVLGKIPLYLGFVFRKQKTWIKTGRS